MGELVGVDGGWVGDEGGEWKRQSAEVSETDQCISPVCLNNVCVSMNKINASISEAHSATYCSREARITAKRRVAKVTE